MNKKIFLFFVLFKVNSFANECNEKLLSNLPPVFFWDIISINSPEQKNNLINGGLDQILFLEMDENIDLDIERKQLWYKSRRDFSRNNLQIKNTMKGWWKLTKKKHNLDNFKLNCSRKEKIVDQMWEDYEKQNMPEYHVIPCNNRFITIHPLRKFNYTKNYSPCDFTTKKPISVNKTKPKNLKKDFSNTKIDFEKCDVLLSNQTLKYYSVLVPQLGRVTRDKKELFFKNIDWLLFIYKDENADIFLDFFKIALEVTQVIAKNAQASSVKKEYYNVTNRWDVETLNKIFLTFSKIIDLSDVKLDCDEKREIVKQLRVDSEIYSKILSDPLLSKKYRSTLLFHFGLPERKEKFLKRYSSELDYRSPYAFLNSSLNKTNDSRLSPSNGAERIANFAILVANIFAGTNITPLNTTESLGSMTLALRNLTAAQIRFLEALGEDQMAIAVKQYASNLAGGKALGKDNLDKILIQTKEYQNVINQKIKSGYILDNKAKKIFASGMSFYLNGIFNLVDTGLNVSQIVGNFSGGIAGIIQGIGLAFIAKDALTTLPLFFNSTGIIFDYANQSGIEDLDDLEKAKDSLGF